MGYLANFIVYTLAMIGVMMVALFVFKNATSTTAKNSAKMLKVTDTLSLGARKTLYIVSAGDEKFLIAGDADRTSLISKLNNTKQDIKTPIEYNQTEDIYNAVNNIKRSYIDRSIIGINSTGLNRSGLQAETENTVLKNLAARIRGGE